MIVTRGRSAFDNVRTLRIDEASHLMKKKEILRIELRGYDTDKVFAVEYIRSEKEVHQVVRNCKEQGIKVYIEVFKNRFNNNWQRIIQINL